MCGLLAAAIGGIATLGAGLTAAWVIAGVCFVATVVALFVYWQRSLSQLRAATRPISPTPPDEVGAPI